MPQLVSLQPQSPVVPTCWLLYSLLPVGEVVLLDGPSGIGKSLLAANFAALLSKSPHADSPNSIVVLTSPDQHDLFSEHLALQEPDHTHIQAFPYQLAPEQDRTLHLLYTIQAIIVEHQPKLLILDSLEELLEHETDAKALHHFWHTLRDLARSTTCSLLIPRRSGFHENRQYGPCTRIASDTARFALTLLWHPTDPDLRVITRAKFLRGKAGEQTHFLILPDGKGYLNQVDPHQHVRPTRTLITWQPSPRDIQQNQDILSLVESFMNGEPKLKSDVKNYITRGGYSDADFERAMGKSKLPFVQLREDQNWYYMPTEQMYYRFDKKQEALDARQESEHPQDPAPDAQDMKKPLENQARAHDPAHPAATLTRPAITPPTTPKTIRQAC